jgi:hypothetical protein
VSSSGGPEPGRRLRFAAAFVATAAVAGCAQPLAYPPSAPPTGKRPPPGQAEFTAGEGPNLSFEREIGKLIGYQDVMARVAAQRTNRVIRRSVQFIATAVFLPI